MGYVVEGAGLFGEGVQIGLQEAHSAIRTELGANMDKIVAMFVHLHVA